MQMIQQQPGGSQKQQPRHQQGRQTHPTVRPSRATFLLAAPSNFVGKHIPVRIPGNNEAQPGGIAPSGFNPEIVDGASAGVNPESVGGETRPGQGPGQSFRAGRTSVLGPHARAFEHPSGYP